MALLAGLSSPAVIVAVEVPVRLESVKIAAVWVSPLPLKATLLLGTSLVFDELTLRVRPPSDESTLVSVTKKLLEERERPGGETPVGLTEKPPEGTGALEERPLCAPYHCVSAGDCYRSSGLVVQHFLVCLLGHAKAPGQLRGPSRRATDELRSGYYFCSLKIAELNCVVPSSKVTVTFQHVPAGLLLKSAL